MSQTTQDQAETISLENLKKPQTIEKNLAF